MPLWAIRPCHEIAPKLLVNQSSVRVPFRHRPTRRDHVRHCFNISCGTHDASHFASIPRLYTCRASGRHRHHRAPDRHPHARTEQGAGPEPPSQVHQQPSPTGHRRPALRHRIYPVASARLLGLVSRRRRVESQPAAACSSQRTTHVLVSSADALQHAQIHRSEHQPLPAANLLPRRPSVRAEWQQKRLDPSRVLWDELHIPPRRCPDKRPRLLECLEDLAGAALGRQNLLRRRH